jgi:ubiquinone/menaquinone biosynthesis C-methylase UbiE
LKTKGRLAHLMLKVLTPTLTDEELRNLLVTTASSRALSLPPADGLRFLFGLDAHLYPVQGQLSVDYGGGLHTKHRHTRYHDFFVQRVKRGERVLDIGCGIGALAFDIAQNSSAYVVGIDLSPDNIAIARTRHSHANVKYEVGDVLHTPLQDPFDVAVLSNVLEHLPERPQFLWSLVRTVRPSRILLRVPVFERDWRVPLKRELGIDHRLDSTHCTEYTLEEYASEMTESGLKVVHQEVRWGEIWAEAVP